MSGERLRSDVTFDDKGDEKSSSSKRSSTFCSDDSTIDWTNSPEPSMSSLPVASSTSTSSPSPIKDHSESVRQRFIAREERKRRTNEKVNQIKEKLKRSETKYQIKKCLLKYGYLSIGASLVIGIGFYLYKYFFSIVSPPAHIEKLTINP